MDLRDGMRIQAAQPIEVKLVTKDNTAQFK